MVKKISFLLISLILLASCVVQQNLNIIRDQGGWATTDLYVNDFFLGVLEDFEPFYEDLETRSIMDVAVDDFVDNLYSTTSCSAKGDSSSQFRFNSRREGFNQRSQFDYTKASHLRLQH
jgi:hypothetical protein